MQQSRLLLYYARINYIVAQLYHTVVNTRLMLQEQFPFICSPLFFKTFDPLMLHTAMAIRHISQSTVYTLN